MRRFRAIAVRIGVGAISCASIGAILFVINHATADPGGPDTDEAIRTAPESFPDLAVQAAPAAAPASASTATAETVATQTPVPPLPLEAAQTTAKAMHRWVGPHLAEVEQIAARAEPPVHLSTTRTTDGQTSTRVALAIAPSLTDRIVERVGNTVGFQSDSRAAYGDRGRWYLFGATSNDAVGFNMLQGMHGEVRRAGFTTERVAAIGDRQAGLAWRKGTMQASVAYVERELSTFGASMQQHFVALTLSFKGYGRPVSQAQKRVSPYAPYQPQWPPQERDPRLRR